MSIESQSFQDFEIIYVDDYSNDNSIKIINEFKLFDDRIRLFINNKNRGTLYTKSFGVTQAKGKYILIIVKMIFILIKIYLKNYIIKLNNMI